jgi:hypothetical protein
MVCPATAGPPRLTLNPPVVTVSMLTNPPIVPFLPTFVKVNAGDDNVVAVSIDTVTTGGFNVNLGGPAVAGQTMSYAYVVV